MKMINQSEYDRQRYLENKEEVKKRSAEYHLANRETRLKQMTERRNEPMHKEKQKEYMKKYWEENKESLKKKNHERYIAQKKKPLKIEKVQMSVTNRERYLQQIKKRNEIDF